MPMNADLQTVSPRILIVNDHSPTLLAMEALLEQDRLQRQYDIVSVTSGEEALRQVLHHHFAVILLDVNMPEMDGFETAELIHSRPSSSNTPIIFLTAHYENEVHRLKGYEIGGVDFLVTPVMPEVLRSKVALFVELEKRAIELQQKICELEEINNSLRAAQARELQQHNGLLAAEAEERKRAENDAHQLATRDALTGLMNRRNLMSELERALREAEHSHGVAALLFIDLNRFKQINDSLGHASGDALLAEVARRIQCSLRQGDIVARFGGDEFVVLLKDISSAAPDHLEAVIHKIRDAIGVPVELNGRQVNISASIGTAVYPRDASTPAVLLRHADASMIDAKRLSRLQAARQTM